MSREPVCIAGAWHTQAPPPPAARHQISSLRVVGPREGGFLILLQAKPDPTGGDTQTPPTREGGDSTEVLQSNLNQLNQSSQILELQQAAHHEHLFGFHLLPHMMGLIHDGGVKCLTLKK